MDLDRFGQYLLTHEGIKTEYARFKQHLTTKFPDDAAAREHSKQNFINGVLLCADCKDVLITGKRLVIRKACIEDADFISETERHPDNSPWVANWPLSWRIEKFGDEDFLQTVIETKEGKRIGFIIFRDMLIKHQQVQLKRIALIDKGKGYGKESLYLSQQLAFDHFQTRRFYLWTKAENIRAQSIYKATGFKADMPDPCTHFYIDREFYIADEA